jgi:2-polyprenyl-6-methoxyphenol hydroxylase-like FAD-dependent oxidoreductase
MTAISNDDAALREELRVSGRLALAGDAAHVATPMVGGGFRQGLLDVAPLAAAFTSQTDPAVALSLYQDERLGDARQHVQRSIAASANYLDRATINGAQGRKL